MSPVYPCASAGLSVYDWELWAMNSNHLVDMIHRHHSDMNDMRHIKYTTMWCRYTWGLWIVCIKFERFKRKQAIHFANEFLHVHFSFRAFDRDWNEKKCHSPTKCIQSISLIVQFVDKHCLFAWKWISILISHWYCDATDYFLFVVSYRYQAMIIM